MAESTLSSRWSRHVEFYVRTVTFLVEDHLFRIPREPLEEPTAFRDMFLLFQGDSETVVNESDSGTREDAKDSEIGEDQSDSETVEGQSDTCPVTLPGVSKKEFESFLRAFMHRSTTWKKQGFGFEPRSTDLCESVLKLSTTWKFDELRNVAIQHLDPPFRPLTPVTKLELASEYKIKQWLLPALLALAQWTEPISVWEGRRIGLENALKLAAVREELKTAKMMDRLYEIYTLKAREGSKSSNFEIYPQSPKDKDKGCIALLTQAFDL
ncbi:hypothetical protein EDC04DRAFT_3138576 [Pisolithus marmoratus]|nr:hypothetical protein EDC04DRAFT_3138576 [Pisolithus marmoratus]